MMGRRRKGRRHAARPRAEATTGTLVRRALGTFLGSLPTIACVVLATVLPVQLLLAWLYGRMGIEDDALWQARYMLLPDLVVGSLTIPATYIAIRGCIEEPGSGPGPLGWVRRAYREALGVWVGSFVTRLMVSFIVGIAGLLPVVVGWMVLSRWRPGLAGLVGGAGEGAEPSTGDLASLLLLLPLATGGVVVFLRYALADVVVALERKDGFAALQRSRALTRGARFRLLAGLALLLVPLEVADLLVTGIGASIGVWAGALVTSATLLAGALPGAFLVHLYLTQLGAAATRGGSHVDGVGPQKPERT